MNESRQALLKLKESQTNKKAPIKIIQEGISKSSAGSQYFEEYDQLLWEGKVKVDMLYLDQLLQKIEESEDIYKALGNYFKTIRQIYEFVNIKPEIYGKNVNFTILEKSNETQKQILSNIIYEYFDRNFYNLTTEQRRVKYLEESRELSKKLIAEGVDLEDAVSFSTKVCIVESLLQKIAFPFASWSRINYLTESDDYRKVFDQDNLIALVNTFKNNANSLAKVIASIV
jgi:hypothetical protein